MTIRKLTVQSQICFFFFLTAFFALGADGLREEISRALEEEEGIKPKGNGARG